MGEHIPELGVDGDAVDGIERVLQFQLVGCQHVLVVGAFVGRVHRQLPDFCQQAGHFGHGRLGGLHHRDSGFRVVHRLVQAGDLGAHLLGDDEGRRAVRGAVDPHARGQFFQRFLESNAVFHQLAFTVQRRDVMVDSQNHVTTSLWLSLIHP